MSPEDRARIAAEVDAMTPNDGGWWYEETTETLTGAIVEMVGHGVPLDRAIAITGAIVRAEREDQA